MAVSCSQDAAVSVHLYISDSDRKKLWFDSQRVVLAEEWQREIRNSGLKRALCKDD